LTRFRKVEVESLAAEKLADGSIAIYDPRTRSVHSLSPSAAVVWEACAEAVSPAEIAAALERKLGHPADDEVVHSAIQQLRLAKLISSEELAPTANLDRRSWLQSVGAALPAVLSFSFSPETALANPAAPSGHRPEPTKCPPTPERTTPEHTTPGRTTLPPTTLPPTTTTTSAPTTTPPPTTTAPTTTPPAPTTTAPA
jgi:hypothetical protein